MQTITLDRRRTLFPNATDAQWNDWQWQWNTRITRPDELAAMVTMSDSEVAYFAGDVRSRIPFALTPYYLCLINPNDPSDPIRRCVIPSAREYDRAEGELVDPLAEVAHSPIPGVVHRYHDRVLLLVEAECPAYCRYCTRGRLVGRGESLRPNGPELDAAIQYVAGHPDVHDVLISGGEPLLWSDHDLGELVSRLSEIDHLDMIRIGTKAPMTMPQRITPDLCDALTCRLPIFFSLHATHPHELTTESTAALNMLADSGIPLGSQTVLLNDVNDTPETLAALFRGLLRSRVRPYYLLLCDPVTGSGRFWVSVDRAKELMNSLRRSVSGYAIPHLIMDLPRGGGKIPIAMDYQLGEDEESYLYRNCTGDTGFCYPKQPR